MFKKWFTNFKQVYDEASNKKILVALGFVTMNLIQIFRYKLETTKSGLNFEVVSQIFEII